ncbi:MAG: hypothetical protein J0H43_07750, partial [Actinobacteria bacterium]|nr:hypothetical protein [Actinomycetota bacterium]
MVRIAGQDSALTRYRARLRRARIIYATVLATLAAVVVTTVSIVWSRGEIAHTSLRTARTPAPATPLVLPSAHQTLAWRSGDHAAMGNPFWRGTVVTFGRHAVRGRVARTGAITWSYTRTDRTVCTAAQTQGATVVVYRDSGNCDELTALDSGTGARRWTRTLDEDGMPVNGTPRVTVTPGT